MGTNEVDAALSAGSASVGQRLLVVIEDQWFERKGAAIAPKDLATTMVAFANAEGGVVVVGASNSSVRGFGKNRRKINDLRRVPMLFTNPPVRARCEEVECINDDGDADLLVIFRVETSERVHELTNGECYLRVGDSSHKLSFAQRQELEFDKGQAQYDGLTADGVGIKRPRP